MSKTKKTNHFSDNKAITNNEEEDNTETSALWSVDISNDDKWVAVGSEDSFIMVRLIIIYNILDVFMGGINQW